ncbi:hypothetical protein ACFL2D_01645 [Patescibacteria group bacterium]
MKISRITSFLAPLIMFTAAVGADADEISEENDLLPIIFTIIDLVTYTSFAAAFTVLIVGIVKLIIAKRQKKPTKRYSSMIMWSIVAMAIIFIIFLMANTCNDCGIDWA